MKAHYLGHVVFYVKDLEKSLAFYRDLVGFQEIGKLLNGKAAALTSGRTHHELLLIEVGNIPAPPIGPHRGLTTSASKSAMGWIPYARPNGNWNEREFLSRG